MAVDFSGQILESWDQRGVYRFCKVDVKVFAPSWQVDHILLYAQQRLYEGGSVVVAEGLVFTVVNALFVFTVPQTFLLLGLELSREESAETQRLTSSIIVI